MRATTEDSDIRQTEIKDRIQVGFYFHRKIYEIIAEKVIKDLFKKK